MFIFKNNNVHVPKNFKNNNDMNSVRNVFSVTINLNTYISKI